MELPTASAALSAVVALQQLPQNTVSVPDPVKQIGYSAAAALLGWAVGALLSWLAKTLKVEVRVANPTAGRVPTDVRR